MKKILFLCCIALMLALVVTFFPVHGESRIYDSVLRLHVVANSDTAEDQNMKIAVRDAVLDLTDTPLSNCKNRNEAEQTIREMLPQIQAAAEIIVSEYGGDYTVDVSLSEEHYPERTYEDCCFPSGDYLSLRVNLGRSEGQNWWCVLFPPMCMSAARSVSDKKSNEDMLAEVGLTPEQYRVITESQDKTKYRVRFRIMEIFDDLFG